MEKYYIGDCRDVNVSDFCDTLTDWLDSENIEWAEALMDLSDYDENAYREYLTNMSDVEVIPGVYRNPYDIIDSLGDLGELHEEWSKLKSENDNYLIVLEDDYTEYYINCGDDKTTKTIVDLVESVIINETNLIELIMKSKKEKKMSKPLIIDWPRSQVCCGCEHGELLANGSSRYVCEEGHFPNSNGECEYCTCNDEQCNDEQCNNESTSKSQSILLKD